MKYNFTLKDNNQKAYKLFTWFLFFLHLIAASWLALKTTNTNIKLSMYMLLVFYAIISIVYYFYKKHHKALETLSLILALLYANFWFQHVGLIAVIAFALVYITVTLVKGKRTTVFFSAEGIHLSRLFKTAIFPWAEIENAILKDNLLTIDFKTNKLIQVEIIESAKLIDETEFNLFCTERMQTPSVPIAIGINPHGS